MKLIDAQNKSSFAVLHGSRKNNEINLNFQEEFNDDISQELKDFHSRIHIKSSASKSANDEADENQAGILDDEGSNSINQVRQRKKERKMGEDPVNLTLKDSLKEIKPPKVDEDEHKA